MFDSVASFLKDSIKTLPYVGRIAGLVRTAVQLVEVDTGEGQNVTLSEKRFPVACSVEGAQCWNNGKYKELAPDSNYPSVMYFEQIGSISYSQDTRLGSKAKGTLRLVCWFNLPKIGVVGCVTPEAIVLELLSKLNKTGSISNFGLNNASFQSEVRGFHRSTEIFTKYSYDKRIIENMLLYPYDYFAIDIDIVLNLSEGCYTPYIPSIPINCIDLS